MPRHRTPARRPATRSRLQRTPLTAVRTLRPCAVVDLTRLSLACSCRRKAFLHMLPICAHQCPPPLPCQAQGLPGNPSSTCVLVHIRAVSCVFRTAAETGNRCEDCGRTDCCVILCSVRRREGCRGGGAGDGPGRLEGDKGYGRQRRRTGAGAVPADQRAPTPPNVVAVSRLWTVALSASDASETCEITSLSWSDCGAAHALLLFSFCCAARSAESA